MGNRLEKGARIAGGAILSLSFASGVAACIDRQSVDKRMEEDPHFAYAEKLYDANDQLSAAQNELGYHPAYTTYLTMSCGKNCKTTIPIFNPPQYPDARYARLDIESAETKLHREDREIVREMKRVAEQLPDENDIKNYDGTRVDNSTFQTQRDELEEIRRELDALAEEQRNTNRELKKEDEDTNTSLMFSILGAISGGLLYVAGRYMRASREDYY